MRLLCFYGLIKATYSEYVMTYVEGSDAENAPSRRTALWQEGKANHIFRKCIQLNLTVNDKD